jgi:drug/metabolite transporter (DMT)-like permease
MNVRRMRRESIGFAIGSVCFAVGSVPGYLDLVGALADNITYFIGSLFFTTAAFIQLSLSGRFRRGAWKSRDEWDDWWGAAVQFVGTLFFNVSTATAVFQHLSSEQAKHHVWRPDVLGSICFLVASALGVAATTHRQRLFDPEARTWWNAWLNMLGSVAFGVSAYAAKVVTASGDVRNVEAVNLGTFLGAVCFFVAALLVLPPRERPATSPVAPPPRAREGRRA